MTLNLPKSSLVLETDPHEVEKEVLLFPFLVNVLFLIGSISMFSRLHQNMLGRRGDVRCPSSSTDHPFFSDTVAFPELAAGCWPTRPCGGEATAAPDHVHPREDEAALLATAWESLMWGPGVCRIGRHLD